MMAFPVDMLNRYSHEDLESSAEDYLSNLQCGDPNCPEFLSLPDHGKIPISLSTVGFVPLYGGEQTRKVLALFAPEDSLTAVALYLADRWWSIDDIVRTPVPSREGLQQVKSVGERVVLYVLNRISYRKHEIERNEVPFLCHGSNDYAKIMWKKGKAIGFYSVKPTGKTFVLELPAHTFERSEDLVEEPEENAIDDEEMFVENKEQFVSETELHASPPVKWSEEETPYEPFNGEVTEEIGKASFMAEEETANEVLGGESKLQSECQGDESLMLFVPLILESPAKPSEDTVSKVLNANDSEVLTEKSTSVEKEGTEERHQESEKKSSSTANIAALTPKEEPSDSGLPNCMVTEAAEESVSENILPKSTSSVKDQNEEAKHNSQEAPVALSRSSLIVVELEGVSFQQPSGQEVQKNQLEEHLEESAEQTDQYTQTMTERAANSSSEEVEIEVPVVNRRNL
ncbi:soluble lamin-associated protein of 75 kDa-like [Cuculus canorus]|uniref:soluble lamin-associated protein of 75 kDa-like n=1 Tax=Cuculus canorus TaxID=55661 RepID=UPI0023AAE414|nr:soluble lamin-associated protein of 75 kDa-like [Cuculus canorus]